MCALFEESIAQLVAESLVADMVESAKRMAGSHTAPNETRVREATAQCFLWEAQFFQDGEFLQRPTFDRKTQALQWADLERLLATGR